MKLLFFADSLLLVLSLYIVSCNGQDIKPNFENAGGYVIGKERCNADTTKDYWLIDLSIFPLPNNYGDTLSLNGITYRHVIKTIDLASQFKYVGSKVDFDFHISQSQLQTLGCSLNNPVTYLLKEIKVQRQSEIR
jgi:hypothetical protein